MLSSIMPSTGNRRLSEVAQLAATAVERLGWWFLAEKPGFTAVTAGVPVP